MTIARNALAVIIGFIIGSMANLALVSVGPTVIPLPAGADVSSMEGLKESMKLFTPLNFLFPWLGHALGTLVGAFIAAKIAASHRMKFAIAIGVLFLLGGITMVVGAGGPLWFILADLVLAYLPMSYLGGVLAGGKDATTAKTTLPHAAFADAIERGDAEAVEAFIREHASLINPPGWTPPPLHCAVLWNQPKIAELLLDCGADIEIRDPDRDTTPIQYAVIYCKGDLIRLLHARGAKTDFTNEGGSTLLQLAESAANGAFAENDDLPASAEYNEIVALLEELGID